MSLSWVLYSPMRAVFLSFVRAKATSTHGPVTVVPGRVCREPAGSTEAAVYDDSYIVCNLSMLPKGGALGAPSALKTRFSAEARSGQNHPSMKGTGRLTWLGQAYQVPIRPYEPDDRRQGRERRDHVAGPHFHAVLEPFELHG